MWNAWYQMLQDYSSTMSGDQPFIEFTYEWYPGASGYFEAPEGTLRELSDTVIAPWLLPEGFVSLQSTDLQSRNKYHSAWRMIYTPGLLERTRPVE